MVNKRLTKKFMPKKVKHEVTPIGMMGDTPLIMPNYSGVKNNPQTKSAFASSSHNHSITNLSDVSIDAEDAGHVVGYNDMFGGAWVNYELIGGTNMTITTDTSANTITFDSTGGGGGGNTFDDSLFQIYDNVDNTKIIAFEANGITTGTTRTFTAPDINGTLMLLEGSQTITGTKLIDTSTQLQFRTTSIHISSASSSHLDIESNSYIDFNINGNEEANITSNQLTFNNGSTDTNINWETDGELHLRVGSNPIIRIDNNTAKFYQAQIVKTTAYNGTTTLGVSDYIALIRTSSSTSTITLPAISSSNDGQVIIVKDNSGKAGTNYITINPTGSDKIDGSSTTSIRNNWGSLTFVAYNGSSSWRVIGKV